MGTRAANTRLSAPRALPWWGQDRGGERALGRYMSLPVDKFVLLDPQLIHALGGRRNRFLLSVPRINARPRPPRPVQQPCRRAALAVRARCRSACRASGF